MSGLAFAVVVVFSRLVLALLLTRAATIIVYLSTIKSITSYFDNLRKNKVKIL